LGGHRYRPDPPPSGIRGRLAALFIAAAGHDTLAKLMYAWMLPSAAGYSPGASWGTS
jgi:hypothetical protein